MTLTTASSTVARFAASQTMSIPMADPTTKPSSSESSFVDRRAFPRRRPRCTAKFRPAEKLFAPDVHVKLTCISQGGASFLSPKAVAIDQHIEVSLLSPAAGVSMLTTLAVVRWICPDAKSGRFRVGCAWVERLSYSQLIPFW
jgi:hypothetical protein